MSRGKNLFNFRDVLRRAGIPEDDKRVNWAVGKLLRDLATERKVPVFRPLTENTNPNGKVGAPHCIAAYPISFFPDALEAVKDWWGGRTSQGDLFG